MASASPAMVADFVLEHLAVVRAWEPEQVAA
jgi:hypothetical protein